MIILCFYIFIDIIEIWSIFSQWCIYIIKLIEIKMRHCSKGYFTTWILGASNIHTKWNFLFNTYTTVIVQQITRSIHYKWRWKYQTVLQKKVFVVFNIRLFEISRIHEKKGEEINAVQKDSTYSLFQKISSQTDIASSIIILY